MNDDDWICGESYDHTFPEPEYIDGIAVLVCRNCGAEIFEEEDPVTDPTPCRAWLVTRDTPSTWNEWTQ